MSIAPTLAKYLASKNVRYDVLPHRLAHFSLRAARAACVPEDCIAKAVLLRDATGYALALLPASNQISLDDLKRQFGDDVELANEGEVAELFDDCARGAVPAVGECYGLDLLVDEDLWSKSDVYFEGGDHATLVHVSRADFAALAGMAQLGRFSRPH
jgi:Ala-tRNA(Pro) deacylase